MYQYTINVLEIWIYSQLIITTYILLVRIFLKILFYLIDNIIKLLFLLSY